MLMSMLEAAILKEKNKIEYMVEEYQRLLKTLPKGTLAEKKTGNKTYYYLKYRVGSKVVSDYVKRNELPVLIEQLEHKKHIKNMIRHLKGELVMADKLCRGMDKSINNKRGVTENEEGKI